LQKGGRKKGGKERQWKICLKSELPIAVQVIRKTIFGLKTRDLLVLQNGRKCLKKNSIQVLEKKVLTRGIVKRQESQITFSNEEKERLFRGKRVGESQRKKWNRKTQRFLHNLPGEFWA